VRAVLAALSLAGVAARPVHAAAVVGLSEGGLHFGDQKVGTTSDPLVLVLSNHGPGTLSVAGFSIIGTNVGDFSITAGGGAGDLPDGGGRKVAVTFSPQGKGERTAQLQINDDGQGSPQVVTLTGTGIAAEDSSSPGGSQPLVSVSPSVLAPAVSLTPASLNFPLRPVGSTSPVMTLKLTNVGTAPLHVINVTFGGPIQSDFHFTGGDEAGDLNPGQSRDITLNFSPTTAGLRTTRVDVITNAASNPDRVPVQGIGVATGGSNLPAIPANALLFASAINGQATSGTPDQVFVSVGQCVTLTLLVKFRGTDFVNVTQDPNTAFFTDPARDGFDRLNHSNVFCPTAADANRTFPIYARAFSQSDHQVITDTLIVHVLRNDGRR
jgi:hypothetical protein